MGASGRTNNYHVPMYKGERVTAEYNPKYRLNTVKEIDKNKYKEKETGNLWRWLRHQWSKNSKG